MQNCMVYIKLTALTLPTPRMKIYRILNDQYVFLLFVDTVLVYVNVYVLRLYPKK